MAGILEEAALGEGSGSRLGRPDDEMAMDPEFGESAVLPPDFGDDELVAAIGESDLAEQGLDMDILDDFLWEQKDPDDEEPVLVVDQGLGPVASRDGQSPISVPFMDQPGPSGAASSTDPGPSSLSDPLEPRHCAAYVLVVPGGKVSYYIGKADVECVCSNVLHGVCRLTRRMLGSTRLGRQGQGRPLGLCIAWLAKGAAIATKAEHTAAAFATTRVERVECRAMLKALEHPDARGLLEAERPKRHGEDSEPDEF